MELINFKYWLKGWLEIESPKSISKKQISIIQKHIEIVKEQDYFIGWLSGFLENKESIKKEELIILNEKVKKQFMNITDDKEIESLLGKELPIFDKRFPKIPEPKYCKDQRTDIKTVLIC